MLFSDDPVCTVRDETVELYGGLITFDYVDRRLMPLVKNNITRLLLDHVDCSLAYVRLRTFVESIENLKVLHINYGKLDHTKLMWIIRDVAQNSQTLEVLSVDGNQIGVDGLNDLYQTLQNNCKIKQVSITDCFETENTPETNIDLLKPLVSLWVKDKPTFVISMRFECIGVAVSLSNHVRLEPVGPGFYANEEIVEKFKSLLDTLKGLPPVIDNLAFDFEFEGEVAYELLSKLKHSYWKELTMKLKRTDKTWLKLIGNAIKSLSKKITVRITMSSLWGPSIFIWKYKETEEDLLLDTHYPGFKFTIEAGHNSENNVFYCKVSEEMTPVLDAILEGNCINKLETERASDVPWSDITGLVIGDIYIDGENMAHLHRIEVHDKNKHISAYLQEVSTRCHTITTITLSRSGSLQNDIILQINNVIKSQTELTELNFSGSWMNPNEIRTLSAGLKQHKGSLKELHLDGNTVGDAAGDFNKSLINHGKLRMLILNYCEMTPDDILVLSAGLKQHKGSLKELHLNGNTVGDAAGALCKSLINHGKLCVLHLDDCEMTPDDIRVLSAGLKQHKGSLKELHLDGNTVGDAAGDLSKSLINHGKLRVLHLDDCEMTPDDIRVLSAGLKQHKGSLKELHLDGNTVGDAAGDLSKSLINHGKLRVLKLSVCEMTPDDIRVLSAGLKQHKGNLEELHLDGNTVGDAAGDLCKSLINHGKLCVLKLSGCEMAPDDIRALSAGLKQHKGSLEELHLDGNTVGDAAGDLCKSLINHEKLRVLNLIWCKMTPDNILALSAGLKQHKGSLEELHLNGNTVGEAAGDLSKSLISHNKLNVLNLRWCDMTPDDIRALSTGLKQHKGNLEELHLDRNTVGDAAGDLSRSLINHDNLCVLKLCSCEMTPDDIRVLSAGLKQHEGTLEELHLDGNTVGDAAGDLCKSLINHGKLRVLHLDDCEMTPDDIHVLSAGLKQHKGSLKELHLDGNTVGDAAGDLCKSLINHGKLRVLHLDDCEMTPDDIRVLSAGLKQHKGSLKELHLDGNTVGDAAGDLSKSLINHGKLRMLILNYCEMTPDDILVLSAGLKQHKGSLKELHLNGNTVGDAAGALCKSLINHGKLCVLHLDDCEMTPDDIRVLSAGLKQHKGSLKELHLDGNTVGDAAGDLSKSLINHGKLRVLHLDDCEMTPDDIRVLSAGLKQHKGSLKELHLDGNTVGDAAGDLSKSLINHGKLRVLKLSVCEMTPDDIRVLSAGLKQHKGNLEELHLDGNTVGDAAGDLCKSLINHGKLCVLKLSGCEMAPDDIRALSAGLKQHKGSLEELHLDGNTVGDAAGDLCKSLINHEKLRVLNLIWCKMTPDNILALSAGLKQHKGSLEELHLNGNTVGEAAGDLSKSLISHNKLNVLNLRWCDMTPDDIRALSTGLKQHKGNLEELHLDRNTVGDAAGDLSRSLINHDNLCVLKLCSCEMTPDDIRVLSAGLKQHEGTLEELHLDGNTVGDAAGDLCKSLINHGKLRVLHLDDCEMTPDDIHVLSAGLKQHKGSLKELHLDGNTVGDAAGDLSKSLINHGKLCVLNLRWCKMTPDNIRALSAGLKQHKGNLEELHLDVNTVGDAAGDLCKSLINHGKLCVLKLSGCEMTPDDIRALSAGLKQHKGSLEELHLDGNTVGDAAAHLYESLINHEKLRVLNLRWCKMTPDNIRALSAGLKQHKGSLEELHLNGNTVGEAAGDLSKSLISHNKLNVLNLKWCDMTPDDIRALSTGLKQHKGNLEGLHLDRNTVGDAVGDLCKSLINHGKLRVLKLSGCEMTPDDIRVLSAGLKQHKGSIEKLHLNGNTVGDAAGDLSKSLINHGKLRVLKLSGCEMTPDDIRNLSAGLKQHKGSLEELHLNGNTVGDAAGDLSRSLINHGKLCVLNLRWCKMMPDNIRALSAGLKQHKGSLEELYLNGNTVNDDLEEMLPGTNIHY